MSAGSVLANVTPIAIIAAAVIALVGNYYVQRQLHNHVRLRQGVDDLKRRLHEFVDLSARYWTLNGPRRDRHRMLEAQMLARKRIIQEESRGLGRRSKRLMRSHQRTKSNRLDLWNAATGGCFQQTRWEADPERVVRVAAEACRIIRSLNQAH